MVLVPTIDPETSAMTRRLSQSRRARDAPLRVTSRGRMVGRSRLEMRAATLPGVAARECNGAVQGRTTISEMTWSMSPSRAPIKGCAMCSTMI